MKYFRVLLLVFFYLFAIGDSFSEDRILLSAPTIVTNTATSISGSSAILNGSGNPNGASTSAWFRYSTTDPGAANDTFGTSTASSALGTGNSSVSYSKTISGLLPGKTYYYAAIGNNTEGTSFGAVQSFTTLPQAPTVSTSSATNKTSVSATLNGLVNPNGAASTCWFRYSTISPGTGNDSFGTRAPLSGGTAVSAGNSSVSVSQNITGLSAATTYYYCAICQNSEGTSFGSLATFTTPTAPTAVTSTVTTITGTTATLNGSGNPNGATSTAYFRYSTTNPGTPNDAFGTRAPISGGTVLGSGFSSVDFSQSITSLVSGQTYYYCAIVTSAEGISFGNIQSFTTASAPTIVTNTATSISGSSAILNGSGNPNGASTSAWFRYSTTDPGAANDTFGTPTASSALGTGNSSVSYSKTISGLLPGKTYYYAAIGNNTEGTSFGAVQSFTTLPLAPTVSTSSATNRTSVSATLNGLVNPNGAASTCWFRYSTISPGTGNDSFGTRAPLSGGTAVSAGNSSVSVSQNITGLSAATTYYYCAICQNSEGTSFGSLATFTTPTAPTAVTSTATTITGTTATLNGSGNPNGATATAYFRYSTSNPGTPNDVFGTRAPISGGTVLGSGFSSVDFSQSITSLVSGQTYYYCAIVTSAEGISFGNIQSFTTASAPTIVTNTASSISGSSAILNGSGNPNGASTSAWFRYSTTDPGAANDTFGTPTASSALGTGNSSVSYSKTISGLLPGKTYYYAAIGNNTEGTSFGAVQSFTTLPQAPTVSTSSATNKTSVSATLNGLVNPNGAASTCWFRYSTISPGTGNDSFGTRAPLSGGTAVSAGNSSVSVSQNITGLSAATTYYYCAICQNSEGTSFGSLATFTTPTAPTAVTSTATTITGTTATLNGSGNPNGATATAYFRYSTSNPGTPNDVFGTRAPVSGGTVLGSGFSSVDFSQSITSLVSGQTYYYCAIVTSAEGISFGNIQSFTTASAPTIVTNTATSISGSSAILNGSGNPNGASTSAWFRYSTTDPGAANDTFGTSTASSALGTGNSSVSYSKTISGLLPGKTYYYAAIGNNTEGTSFGAVQSFTTLPQAPTVSTTSSTNRTSASATLNSFVNPNGAASTCWFRYSTISPGTGNDSFGTRAPLSGGTAVSAGNSSVSVSQNITGLSAATTYYYCAICQNSEGTSFGSLATFTTPTAPTAVTSTATTITGTTATLNGSGNPNGATSTAYFRYSTTNPGTPNDVFGTRAPVSGGTILGSGFSSVDFFQSISSLVSGQTYYYCAIVTSAEGISFGNIQSFTTASAPTIITNTAMSISGSSAILNGSGNPNGASTSAWFRYSTIDPGAADDTFGTSTASSALGTGNSSVSYSKTISGLLPGKTYYYAAIGNNTEGTSFGAVQSFTTLPLAPTVSTSSAANKTSVSATLNGLVNPNGAASTCWFRYSTISPGTGNDSFGTRAPLSGGTAVSAGNSSVSVSQNITGLSAATTYYYCAICQNSEGTSFGSLATFTTLTDCLNTYSLKSGNWIDPTVWSCGNIPTINDNVTIKSNHKISLNVGESGYCKYILTEPNSVLSVPLGSKIYINSN